MSGRDAFPKDAHAGQYARKYRLPEVDKHVDEFLSIMCESSRRQIMELLTIPRIDEFNPIPERRSTDIARELGLAPSTVSEHLKQLASAGLITSRREGNNIYYRVSNMLLVQAFQNLVDALGNDYSLRKPRTSGESTA